MITFRTLALLLLLLLPAQAAWQSRDSNYNNSVAGFTPSCSQSTALLARMDGGQNSAAVDALICGMVTDGNWAGGGAAGNVMDAFYVFAINSKANALINWVSTSFPLTENSSPVFTANQGYTAGASGFLTSTFNAALAGGNLTLNSAALGVCNFSSVTNEGQQTWVIEADGSGNFSQLEPFGTNTMFYDVNDTAFISTAGSFTNYQGQWITTRTTSTLVTLYKNGSSVATSSQVSSALPNSVTNFLGGPVTANLIGGGFMGAGLTSTKVTQIFNRLHTYFVAAGAPSGC